MKNLFLQIPFFILLLSSAVYLQEIPESILIDEYGRLGCEDILARTDAFFSELQNKPHSIGYLIIQIDNKNLENGLKYEQWIKGHINFRGFDETRLNTIRSLSNKSLREGLIVKSWLVPKGAELPDFSTDKWDLTISKNRKPFVFSMNYDDGGLCPSPEIMDINIFAEYLTANPKARGNIVIKTPLKKEFLKEKQSLLKLISNKYKISSKRLRFFNVKEQHYYTPETPEVEIWILP